MSTDEHIFYGASGGGGVSVGTVVVLSAYHSANAVNGLSDLSVGNVDGEVLKYRRAIDASRMDLDGIIAMLVKDGSSEAVSVLRSHIQILGDPMLNADVEEKIRSKGASAGSVLRSIIRKFSNNRKDVDSKFSDVLDVCQRVMCNLYPSHGDVLSLAVNNSILFAQDIFPSNIACIGKVNGLVTEFGSVTAHVALIARSMGVSYVSGIDFNLISVFGGALSMVDGDSGVVVVNPSKATLADGMAKKHHVVSVVSDYCDGWSYHANNDVKVFANVGSMRELDKVVSSCADGVGLVRSEFLFLGMDLGALSEEEQFVAYKGIMVGASGMSVTFRVFDIGGDKWGAHFYPPFPLSKRGMRFLMGEKNLFVRQIRALLRASVFGKMRILLPMVSDVSELVEAKSVILDISMMLNSEGCEIDGAVPVGAMVEMPSAVMLCDHIADESCFLSIGTNDLAQYSLAVDRKIGNCEYGLQHPSIIRMVAHIAKICDDRGIPVTICGEMASDPKMVPLLLAIGIKEFSCTCSQVQLIRQTISQYSVPALRELSNDILHMKTQKEIETYMEEKILSMCNQNN